MSFVVEKEMEDALYTELHHPIIDQLRLGLQKLRNVSVIHCHCQSMLTLVRTTYNVVSISVRNIRKFVGLHLGLQRHDSLIT